MPAPINIGSSDQIKTGGLTIGGIFRVAGAGSGAIVGSPVGDNMGPGALNAEKICIQGVCLTSWVMGDAFVQNGNSFGTLATLGTNDNFPLAFETNNVERMRIDTAGNVGIGTTSPAAKLHIEGAEIRLRNTGGAPSWQTRLHLIRDDYRGAGMWISSNETYLPWFAGAPYASTGFTIGYHSTQPEYLANSKLFINTDGNIGIGTTTPSYKLVVAGASPREYIWPSGGGNPELDFGNVAGDSHWAIYRDLASNELRFWQSNDNVTLTAQGDINSRRCFGPVYVGQTVATYNGARGGYTSANALCAASIAGSHVCTTGEILETIKCNQPSLPTTDQAWISNGPPGYTARANDCTGWTSTSPSGSTTVYGAIWAFDASGGVGWVTTCNQSLKFACCK